MTIAAAVNKATLVRQIGRVQDFYGLIIESEGPDAFVGERCLLSSGGRTVPAEVVGLRAGRVLLMPFGDVKGIRRGSEVIGTGKHFELQVGEALLGRVIDAFGRPLDGKPLFVAGQSYRIDGQVSNPLHRRRISQRLETGVKVVDTLLPLGCGQRMGIFAGSGVGKSTLLGMIARNVSADVNVIGLIGERGREVGEFVADILGEEGLRRSVVVAATSDAPALVRAHAALVATTIAEYFQDSGRHVVLTMDSVTRYAMALREIGLAVGEPPTARGYTPSVFAALPRLLERAGLKDGHGSLTALYTVLIEADDINDPIADTVRAILDGHIVLSRERAKAGQFPAVDLLHSTSRLAQQLWNTDEEKRARSVTSVLAEHDRARDMVEIGAYKRGSSPTLDRALRLVPKLDEFLTQPAEQVVPAKESNIMLARIMESDEATRQGKT